jgi:hypothetical protein
MSEKPIIFSSEMVKAILEGRKTQTRRVLTEKTSIVGVGRVDWSNFCWDGSQIYLDTCQHGHTEKRQAPLPWVDGKANEYYPYEHQYLHVPYRWEEDMTVYRIYPKWDVGDRLWVRETFCYDDELEVYFYKADGLKANFNFSGPWTPSIHMPRWASRIILEITDIRVERLQGICGFDCWGEGLDDVGLETAEQIRARFARIWNSLNAKRGYPWESNPWVWVISFQQCT